MADEHLISLQPGTVIAGRYEVVKCLGAGSMGLVYACRHKELAGHKVAIKVLFPEVANDKIAAARFRNEIFAAYGVSHPNVVRAYEYIRDGDLVAYTMEYVDGGDLAQRLNDAEPILIPDIISILAQMASGVQAIHDAGIVHRDLKPENILLTKDGQVKIADFGIARTGHGPKLTEHGGVVGTIDYVSPEYMLNSQVDWRSDIYALGILGYEMVTGESPFRGDSVYATMTKRLKTDPKPPSLMRPECPSELDAIILHAMARNPEERYQSAHEMLTEVQTLLPGSSQRGATAFLQTRGVAIPSAQLGLSSDASRQTSRRSAAQASAVVGIQPVGVEDATIIQNPIEAATLAEDTLRVTHNVRGDGAANGNLQRKQDPGQMVETSPSTYRLGASERSSAAISRGWDGGGRGPNGTAEQVESEGLGAGGDDTLVEPVRMERVLAYPDMGSGGAPQALPREVNISGAFDENRFRRLHEMAGVGGKSMWLEMVVLVVAVLIGIGVGLACVSVFAPGILGGRVGSVTPSSGGT